MPDSQKVLSVGRNVFVDSLSSCTEQLTCPRWNPTLTHAQLGRTLASHWSCAGVAELMRRWKDGSEFSSSHLEKFPIELFLVRWKNLTILWKGRFWPHFPVTLATNRVHSTAQEIRTQYMKVFPLFNVHVVQLSINSIKINSVLLVTLIKPSADGLRGKKTGNWKNTKTHNMYL